MNPIEFWQQKWKKQEIGFHQTETNRYLLKFQGLFSDPLNKTVFVPLCGKSQDMIWLKQQKLRVKGIECSESAVRNFFEENGLQPNSLNDTPMPTWHANNIELTIGDFFQLDYNYFKDIDLVYDRAALIALNKTEREQYVNKLLHSLPKGADIFLITLTYPEHEMQGPPFSLSAEEICRLYSERYLCKIIAQQSILHKEPHFIDKGLSEVIETVYYLTEY